MSLCAAQQGACACKTSAKVGDQLTCLLAGARAEDDGTANIAWCARVLWRGGERRKWLGPAK